MHPRSASWRSCSTKSSCLAALSHLQPQALCSRVCSSEARYSNGVQISDLGSCLETKGRREKQRGAEAQQVVGLFLEAAWIEPSRGVLLWAVHFLPPNLLQHTKVYTMADF